MKNILKHMLVLAAASAITVTAKATPIQTDFSNQDSIVMIGFRASLGTGAAKNLLVALGTMSELLGVNGSGASYNAQFNLGSALSSTFGSDWTRSTVLWGAFGAQNGIGDQYDYNSLIASSYDTVLNAEQSGVNPDAAFVFSGQQGNLAASAVQGGGLATGIASATVGANSIYSGYAWSSMDASSGGSWAFYNGGGGAFNYFSGEQGWTTDTTLRFAQYNPFGDPVAVLDDLTASIDTTTGIVTITAIPEPSTYALMGVGLLGLVLAARRRATIKD